MRVFTSNYNDVLLFIIFSTRIQIKKFTAFVFVFFPFINVPHLQYIQTFINTTLVNLFGEKVYGRNRNQYAT